MTGRPPVIGLTGGIGSGKSAAADRFADRGAAVVDSDLIAHQLTAAGGAAIEPIRQAFGNEVITAEGALDRGIMRALAFEQPEARKRLEAILHPMIRAESERQCQTANAPYVMLVVPLLIESGVFRERCQRIVVVDCPESVQVERVKARSGLSDAQVRAIMDAQISRHDRLAAADDIIDNSGDLDALFVQVDRLHECYLRLQSA
ncbi:dephospho-CoA kinase [Nitrogeniibacter aestuarii]|uniref:dephospho-CoA kinase n=1 Tax=Nitrogeniibacter aestuarii TaxID=2815343 RepID=UPI001E4297B7|nr:dephospho-CoA kinase [Nitrogeniibacter aestuarii]